MATLMWEREDLHFMCLIFSDLDRFGWNRCPIWRTLYIISVFPNVCFFFPKGFCVLFFFWQVNLADLNSDEDQASKKIRLWHRGQDSFLQRYVVGSLIWCWWVLRNFKHTPRTYPRPESPTVYKEILFILGMVGVSSRVMLGFSQMAGNLASRNS